MESGDKKTAAIAQNGIAVHHGGLEYPDRRKIEDAFRSGSLMVVISTSTLAVGVNLPAHTVVVAGTKFWNSSGRGSTQPWSEIRIPI